MCWCSLPGDYGFDPLGLGRDPAALKWYREAELIHGRWAMAAVVGIFIGQGWSGVPWFEAGADPAAVAPFSFGSLLGTQLLLMGGDEEVDRLLEPRHAVRGMGNSMVEDGGKFQQRDGSAGVSRRQVLRPVGVGRIRDRRTVCARLL
jgi:hypothetical protein